MFERFTDEARRVIVSGQEAARQRGQVEIGTEHVLLGLVGEHDCDGARALEQLEISLAAVRVQIDELAGCGEGVSGHTDPIPSLHRPRGSSSCRRARRYGSDTARSAPNTSSWAWCVSATASPARCSSSSAPTCPGPVRPSWRWYTSSAPSRERLRASALAGADDIDPAEEEASTGPDADLIDWDDPAALGAAPTLSGGRRPHTQRAAARPSRAVCSCVGH